MKLTINNRDLPYTIDTYGMFNGESVEDSEADYYAEEYNLTDKQRFSLEFEYNHPGIVKDLALVSVGLLQDNLTKPPGRVVRSISDPLATTSPQFYNYTTDSYTAEWDINIVKLLLYISKHWEGYREFAAEEWSSLSSNINWETKKWLEYNYRSGRYDDLDMFKQEDVIVSMLDYYVRNVYDPEDYNSSMFESGWEAYGNNMTLSKDSQRLIDRKEAKRTK